MVTFAVLLARPVRFLMEFMTKTISMHIGEG
jgi:hypothetical protein